MTWLDDLLRATTPDEPVVLVPDLLVMTELQLAVVSETPIDAELSATVSLGSVGFAVQLNVPSMQYAIRKADEGPWPIAELLAKLGLESLDLDGLTVSDMALSGSARTGLFRAMIGFGSADTWKSLSGPGVPFTMTGVELEVGTFGGDAAYAAISASGRLGDELTATVAGTYHRSGSNSEPGTWGLRAELDQLDPGALLEHLGWGDTLGFPTNRHAVAIGMEYDSADGSLRVAMGLEMVTPIQLDDLVSEFVDAMPESPTLAGTDFFNDATLRAVDIVFEGTKGGDASLRIACSGDLDVDPSTTVGVDLDIVLERQADTVTATFGGTLALGGDDPVVLGIDVHHDAAGTTVAGTFLSTAADSNGGEADPHSVTVARPVELSGLVPAELEVPAIELFVEHVALVWHKQAGSSWYVVSLGVAAGDRLQPTVPVIGALFPDPGLLIGFDVVGSSRRFDPDQDDDVAAINRVNAMLKDRGVREFPSAIRTGLQVGQGRLDLGLDRLELGNGAGTPAAATAAGSAAAGSANGAIPAPTPASADDTKWTTIQRAFGPVHVARAGIGYADGAVTFRLDASIELTGLVLSLEGLGVRAPLSPSTDPGVTRSSETLEVVLTGLGVAYSSVAVSIGGSFVGTGHEPPEFAGSAVIATKAFSLTAIGAYRDLGGHPSLFVFAAISKDFGGPPAFHVTGLALGVGYNRDFVPPAIEAVEHHPFLEALDDPPDATGMLQRLAGSVPARVGAFWLAAGVRFESFGMIRSRAVVLVRLGGDVEILLLGLSELTLPRGATKQPYVRAELALKVSVKPAAGTALAEAMLTDRSYVLDPACRITGRFAFALWFGDHPRSGDFVLSLGGYHPRFRRPEHYPVVPRLAVAWQNGPITIKGEAYFALTPSSVMAGGQLEASYVDGPLTATFLLRAHFLISWKPFFYDVEIGVAVRVELTTTTVLGDVVIAAALGADVHLWGPELAGRARVSWGALSFDVEFGAVGADPDGPRQLAWQEFRDSFLPPPESVCEVQIAAGLLDTVPHGAPSQWVVRADQLSLSTRSAVPSTTVTWPGDAGDPFAATRGDLELGVQLMGDGAMTSTHTVVVRRDGEDGAGVPLSLRWARPSLVRQAVPAALWSDKALAAAPSADALERRVVGLSGLRPLANLSTDNPAARDLADFATSNAGPPRDLPLVRPPAQLPSPAPTTPVGTTTGYAAVASGEVDDQVVARRDTIIREARSRGFLAEDDVVADRPVTLPVLAQDVTEVFASDPMVGDGRVGGAAARLGVEAPMPRPPAVDLSIPPEVTRLVVRLLAELAYRPYVEAGGTSSSAGTVQMRPVSGARVLVIEGDDGDDDSDHTDDAALERTLGAGGGVVFDLALRGGAATPLTGHGSLPTAVLDLGEDHGLSARVVIVDRHGGLLSDMVASGEVPVPGAAERVVVTAGMGDPGTARVCGWNAASTLVRVSPRVFLVEEGLLELQADAGSHVGVVRGAAAGWAPGWTRTSLPTDIQTVAVLARRTSRDGSPASSLRVLVEGPDGQALRLQPEHVVHESADEVAVLFAVPTAVRGVIGSRVAYDVQVAGAGVWALTGVLGYRDRPHLVRRAWQPGRSRLAAPTVDPTSTRVVRLHRERQELAS